MESEGMTGPVFGSRDNWKGLGVFFDSFDNDAKVCTMVYSLWLYYGFLLWFFFGAFERIWLLFLQILCLNSYQFSIVVFFKVDSIFYKADSNIQVNS